jgi:hypothetical protein
MTMNNGSSMTRPVRSIKNQYLGVNAHLHSLWQGIGKWNRFHNVHVAQLLITLKARLLPMGYTAEVEESLQIRRVSDVARPPRADILIGDIEPRRARQGSMSPMAGVETQTLTLDEMLEGEEDQEHPYYAVAIYERLANVQLSDPVAWIELLSPSNKGGSLDAQVYRAKRKELLRSGLVFVEIDYLHETPPTFARMGDYTQDEAGSHAYRIIVLDPRPNLKAGRAFLYQFDVDTPLPSVTIPLNAGDLLRFDFGMAYRKTIEEGLYGYDLDYSQLPMNFDRYRQEDQARIAARMLAVLEAVHKGVDLETGPFPAKELPLDEALAQLEALRMFIS